MLKKDLKGLKKVGLSNGFEVIIVPYPEDVSSVVVVYRNGSSSEDYNKTGVAHLLEHLMFNGTRNFGPFSEYIDSFGGYDNAFTDKDITVYHSVIPSDKLYQVMLLEADRMENLLFNGFENEKRVIYEEYFMSEYEEDEDLWTEVFSHLMPENPYSHPVIGWESDIRNLSVEDIKNFYEKFYTPDNSFAVIVSNVPYEKIVEYSNLSFGKVSKKGAKPLLRYTNLPYKYSAEIIIKSRHPKNRFIVAWRLPFVNLKFNLIFNIFSRILDLERSSPLWKLVEDGDIDIFNARIYEYRIANILAIVGEGNIGKFPPFEKIRDIVENFKPESRVVERVKRMLKSEVVISFDEAENVGINTALNYLFFGKLMTLEDILQEIDGIKAEDFDILSSVIRGSPMVCAGYSQEILRL